MVKYQNEKGLLTSFLTGKTPDGTPLKLKETKSSHSVIMNGIRTIRMLRSPILLYINSICILLLLTVLSTNIGFTSSALNHLIASFLILGLLLLNLPLKLTILTLIKKNTHQFQLIGGLSFCLGGFLLLIVSTSPLLWVCSIPLTLSGLASTLSALNKRRTELPLLAIASFASALVFIFLQSIPQLWHLYQQSSLVVSQTIGLITGTPLLLGPSISGADILLIFLIVLCSVYLATPDKKRKDFLWFSVDLTSVLIIWLISLSLRATLTTPSEDVLLYQILLVVLFIIPTIHLLLRCQGKQLATEPLPCPKYQLHLMLKNGAVWAVVLLFFSTTLITVFMQAGIVSPEQQKIIFYGKNMVGAWDVPAYGKYGKDAVGMFGLWPVYSTTVGYTTELIVENNTAFLGLEPEINQTLTRYLNLTDYTRIIQAEKITSSLLENTAVFVIANLNVSLSEEEHTILWEYVRNGGSLLVLGDHTDVGGMQTPLNDLLAPVGIRFRFDTALPLDQKFKWLTSLRLAYHPLTASPIAVEELQYGIGASLDVTAGAFPLVTGTYAFSDTGNRSNSDIAYLGDYTYQNGEQLGDIILVAGAYYGQGSVLVFGDTSSFQNPALPFSSSFMQRTFSSLSQKQTQTTYTLQVVGSLLLLTAAVVVYRLSKEKTITFALFSLLLCVSLLTATTINSSLMNPAAPAVAQNLVFIDASHGERFSLESFTDISVNGLIVNLHRNNLLPVVLRHFSKEQIQTSSILFFIAPTKTFTAEEVAVLDSYMTHGGVVVLATGYDDKEASLPLLNAFELDIDSTPLGPVPYVEENLTFYQNEPRFVDSWPIIFQEDTTNSYYNFTWADYTYHLVIFIKHGSGGLLVISDSRYLLDKNIESIYDYWPGNILFLKYLLDELPLRGDSI